MADIEKTIKGLQTCIPFKYNSNEEKECRHDLCPYGPENHKTKRSSACIWDLMEDALKIIKEQRQIVRCENCKHAKERNDIFLKAYQCKMTWLYHDGDWFCADGETKFES